MTESELIGAPVRQSLTFGGLVKVALGQTTTVLSYQGVTFKVTCTPSPEDPAQNVASVLASTDEDDTYFSSSGFYTGSYVVFGPTDGDVAVCSYDAGCDTGFPPGGPGYSGGIAFSLAKPSGLVAVNGVLSCGVAVLGADAVFSGVLFQ